MLQFIDQVRAGLEKESFVILRDVFSESFSTAVREEIEGLQTSGKLNPAKIGKGHLHHLNADIRGDGTSWFDPEALSPLQSELWEKLQELREGLNSQMFLGLWELEGHYAVYGPGTFYRKHLDRFTNDSKRVLSVVLFFNAGWIPADGGLLRLETSGGIRDVMPEAGTAVLFFSDRIPHEVTETRRERFSFAGWFKTRT